MKIALYGSCSYPFFFKEAIALAQKKQQAIDWRPIILWWRHLPLYEGLVPKENLFYVPDEVNRLMKEPMPDLDLMKSYPGSLARDIAADKNIPGQLRRYPSTHQMKSAVCYYQVYKKYLSKERPDYIFFPIIEAHEGLILYAVARELGIRTIFHTSARNLHLSFFSQTPSEDLPSYVMDKPVAKEWEAKAQKIVEEFKRNPAKAVEFTYEPRPEELVKFKKWLPLRKKFWRAPLSLWNLYQDAVREPHSARPSAFWFQPYMYFAYANRRLIRWKSRRREGFTHVHRLDQLPKHFIYMPLHVYPELTVTTMAPYFEDQLRAIDMVRLNMPADHLLVIKEHPMMLGKRPMNFYKTLSLMAGVVIADVRLPSVELIRRASLTAGITGTASLEALLLGKPSLLLAKTFFEPWVPRLRSFDQFDRTILKAMQEDRDTIQKRAVDCVARVLEAGYDFILWDPYNPDLDPRYTMNWRNIENFLNGLIDHLRRLSEPKSAVAP
jgi:hypothetical protein